MSYTGTQILGCDSPALGADKDTYTDKIDTSMEKVDLHDHTTGKGTQIPTAGIVDLAVTTAKLGALSVTADKIAEDAVTADKIADGAIDAAAKLASSVVSFIKRLARSTTASSAALGEIALSSSSGTFQTTNNTYTDVTNLSVDVVSGGGLFEIGLVSDGSGTESYLGFSASSTQDALAYWRILDGATVIASGIVGKGQSTSGLISFREPVSSISTKAVLSAGAHTLKVQVLRGSGGNSPTVSVVRAKLMAHEV